MLENCCVCLLIFRRETNATRQFGAAKSKRKTIKYRTKPWSLKQNRKQNSKIDERIKKSLYNWIMHHPQVVQSQIDNDCLKMKIDGHTETQLVPKNIIGGVYQLTS